LLQGPSLPVAVREQLQAEMSRRDKDFVADQHGLGTCALLLNQSKLTKAVEISFHLKSS
jgi:hypothetical protein